MLLVILVVIVAAIAATRRMLSAVILLGVYSLVSAVWLVVMDAADVAFTEAVVGAGVSTIVLLGAILLTRGAAAKVSARRLVLPAVLALGVGAILIYAALGLPDFGDPASPANAHVGRDYLEARRGRHRRAERRHRRARQLSRLRHARRNRR